MKEQNSKGIFDMSWFEKLIPSRIRTDGKPGKKKSFPEGLRKRLDMFLDKENRVEIGDNVKPVDILKFKDSKKYKDRLSDAQKSTDEKDSFIVMKGKVHGIDVVVGSFDFRFMGGSMGSVMGERFVQGANEALRNNIPYIVFSASGGARMQEALFSLMQMAKTSAVLGKLSELSNKRLAKNFQKASNVVNFSLKKEPLIELFLAIYYAKKSSTLYV